MLKFFRRIRRKLIDGGNPPVRQVSLKRYLIYAIGEMLLVMIGILLALQVNNNNQYRIDRKHEKHLIEQLNAEFSDNKIQLEKVRKGHADAYEKLNLLINHFPIDPNNFNLDTLNYYYVEGVYTRSSFNPNNTTINSINDNVSFNIIRNRQLRQKLQIWNAILEDYLEDEKALTAFLDNIIYPYQMEHGLIDPLLFKDERLDLSFLSTPNFEAVLKSFRWKFTLLLDQDFAQKKGYELEIDILMKTIDEIIELTESKNN